MYIHLRIFAGFSSSFFFTLPADQSYFIEGFFFFFLLGRVHVIRAHLEPSKVTNLGRRDDFDRPSLARAWAIKVPRASRVLRTFSWTHNRHSEVAGDRDDDDTLMG